MPLLQSLYYAVLKSLVSFSGIIPLPVLFMAHKLQLPPDRLDGDYCHATAAQWKDRSSVP